MTLVSGLRVICTSGFLVDLLVVVCCSFVWLLFASLLPALHCFYLDLFGF